MKPFFSRRLSNRQHFLQTTRMWVATVSAAQSGTVIMAGPASGYGTLVVISHGGDLTATQNTKGEWELRETVYQVDVQLVSIPPPAMVDPGPALDNLAVQERKGALGPYGFHDALDYTRPDPGTRYAVVRNYMAHHVGMTLVAFTNVLVDEDMDPLDVDELRDVSAADLDLRAARFFGRDERQKTVRRAAGDDLQHAFFLQLAEGVDQVAFVAIVPQVLPEVRVDLEVGRRLPHAEGPAHQRGGTVSGLVDRRLGIVDGRHRPPDP